jgi:hypothetical protein
VIAAFSFCTERNASARSELLKAHGVRRLRCYPVSARINSAANDDEACSAPVERPAEVPTRLFSQLRACDMSMSRLSTEALNQIAQVGYALASRGFRIKRCEPKSVAACRQPCRRLKAC